MSIAHDLAEIEAAMAVTDDPVCANCEADTIWNEDEGAWECIDCGCLWLPSMDSYYAAAKEEER